MILFNLNKSFKIEISLCNMRFESGFKIDFKVLIFILKISLFYHIFDALVIISNQINNSTNLLK